MNRIAGFLVTVFCGTFLFYIVGASVQRWVLPTPVHYISAREVPFITDSGNIEILVHASGTADRTCFGSAARQLSRFEIRDGFQIEVARPIIETGLVRTDPGKDYILQVAVPRNLPAGEWTYKSFITYQCNGLDWLLGPRLVEGPPVKFVIRG